MGEGRGFQYGNMQFNTGETPEQVAAFVREYDGTNLGYNCSRNIPRDDKNDIHLEVMR